MPIQTFSRRSLPVAALLEHGLAIIHRPFGAFVTRSEGNAAWLGTSRRVRIRPVAIGLPGGEEGKKPLLSIIIPALDEAHAISLTLASTQDTRRVERIVVDGGSTDSTVEVARSWGARVVRSSRGRARQMNAGALDATGELLLFLHADTRLCPGFAEHVCSLLSRTDVAAGAFQLHIDDFSAGLRWIERVANWRSRRLGLPYGDQAIFLRASTFRAVGGFPDLPILEDFEFVRRLRRIGQIAIAPIPVITSPRRWQQLGLLRTTLINQLVVLGFFLGVSPGRLSRFYSRNGSRS